MFQFSVVHRSVVIAAFLSVSYAFSVRQSRGRWLEMMRTADGPDDPTPADDYGEVDGPDPSPVIVFPGVEEPVIDAQLLLKRYDDSAILKPETEYLLERRQRKWKQNFRKPDSRSGIENSVTKDLRFILKKNDKRKPTVNHRIKSKYFNSYGLKDRTDLSKVDDDLIGKEEEDEKEETTTENDDDYDDWTSPEQLERDYVHVARSTSGFIRQSRRPLTSSSGSLHAVVDVLVVVDNALYRRALQRNRESHKAVQDIRRYYGLVISLVDSRYSQIDDNSLSVRVRLAGIHISRDRSDSPWSERHLRTVKHSSVLDPNVGLEKFHEWLKEEHRRLPKFDHAMAFTGYSLVTAAGKHTAGMAYIGTVCKVSDGYACSIIQEDGGLSSVSTAVHELGHSLGAKHDGEGTNAVCPASHNYIMAPGNSAEKESMKNFFVFSPCTIREFKALLSTEDVECLFDSSPDTGLSSLPGQEISPDDQCKDVFGQDSGFCEIDDPQSPDDVCSRLWCIKPGKAESCITRGHLTAVLGTPCATGKVCKNGQCLDKDLVLETLNMVESNGSRSIVVTNRPPPGSKPHRPQAATEKPVKIELGRPKCREDVGPEYCRTTIYQRPDLCQRSDMAAYCCFSCSFV